jgi:hypothetical protein
MSTAVPLQLETGTADVTLLSGRGHLIGWSLRESATVAAAASVVFRDGSATGNILAIVTPFAADGTDMFTFDSPVRFNEGLYVERESGETEGAVYVR